MPTFAGRGAYSFWYQSQARLSAMAGEGKEGGGTAQDNEVCVRRGRARGGKQWGGIGRGGRGRECLAQETDVCVQPSSP